MRASHGEIEPFIEGLEIHLKTMIVVSSYLQSLNQIYGCFSPIGITSIYFRWVENKEAADRLIEIRKNIKQLYSFRNKLLKLKIEEL